MFGRNDLVQNLKLDILDLKKDLASSREDNQLLKVKIRKLQNEISKRDRQIETLLDPRKSAFVKQVISERGASVLINLRERNNKLEKILVEKELLIKRLQNDLQTKKLYTVKSSDKKRSLPKQSVPNRYDINIPYCEQNRDSDSEKEDDTKPFEYGLKSVSMYDISQGMEKLCSHPHSGRSTATKRAASADRVHSGKCANIDIKAQYDGLSRDHLLSIIESLKNNQQRLSPRIRKGGSPESDLERNELLCDTPHLEIQQLQNYFMDMLSEVDQLKTTILDLKSDQDKTVHLLKEKDNNIVKLAKEIKSMKKPKLEFKNALRVKPTISSRLCMYKKVNTSEKTQERSCAKTKAKAEVENEINVCTYIEPEDFKAQQKENGVQIVQTRTISIQKFADSPNYADNPESTEKDYYELDQDSTIEEKTRRETFNCLLEKMLDKTDDAKYSTEPEDSELETEYIL